MKNILIAAALFAASATAFAADSAPTIEKCQKPEYPRASLMNEESGAVSFSVLVTADGAVTDTKLETSSGFKALDKAAMHAYSTCKFKPAQKDGKAQQAWTKVQYTWTLG